MNPGRPLLRFFRLGIQSKLLVTLLVCSIISAAVIGIIGYVTGRNSLREVVTERLVELRESHKRQVEALFAELKDSVNAYSTGFSAVEALRAFNGGFAELANATISPAQHDAIVKHYENQLIKPIERATAASTSARPAWRPGTCSLSIHCCLLPMRKSTFRLITPLRSARGRSR